MKPIEEILTVELIDDLADSVADVRVCETALALGITHTKDGTSVAYRRWEPTRGAVSRRIGVREEQER